MKKLNRIIFHAAYGTPSIETLNLIENLIENNVYEPSHFEFREKLFNNVDVLLRNTNHKEKFSNLIEVLMLDMETSTPEKNCSCFIFPPCADCVEYSHTRELLNNAKKKLRNL